MNDRDQWKAMQIGEKWGVVSRDRLIVQDDLTELEARQIANTREAHSALATLSTLLRALAQNPASAYRHDIDGILRQVEPVVAAGKVGA